MGHTFPELSMNQEFYFQWHITEKCNLRCKHCYHENYVSEGELDTDALLKVLEQIDTATVKWGKLASLSITGGEPLLRLDSLKQIIPALETKEHIYYYDLLTNGTLINEDVLNTLDSSRKLRRVQLSLEGSNRENNDAVRGKGSFARIVDGITLLRKKNIPISIMVTLTKANYQDVPAIVEMAAELGIDYLSFERFIPEGNGGSLKDQFLTREELKSTFELIAYYAQNEKRLRVLTYRPLFAVCGDNLGAMCSVGTNALTIMHDGTVYPCRRLPIPLGHVLKDGLFKIWYDSELLWQIRNCRNLKGKCRDCELISTCRGCRAMAYFVNGDYLGEDPQCWK